MLRPDYPIYIPSKSRAAIALTPRFLDRIDVPYRLVIENQQYKEYREYFPKDKLIILDSSFQEDYDTCDELGGEISRGSGPARNFIWEHSISEGWDKHWVVDDNIRYFMRMFRNESIIVGDGTVFHAMEDFAGRYTNVALAGPQYMMFVPFRKPWPPFVANTRVFSCILVRNDLPFRWRCRYNEDLDLSLRVLKAGWCTVLFNAFLQHKIATQQTPGGNMEAFYAEKGTLPKSQMIVRLHPDVARIAWRFNRWHHYVDYRPFKNNVLTKRPDYVPPEVNPYRLEKIQRYSGEKGLLHAQPRKPARVPDLHPE